MESILFEADRFAPERIGDPRLRSILSETTNVQDTEIRPSDLLALAVDCGGDEVCELLAPALREGADLHAMPEVTRIAGLRQVENRAARPTRGSFRADALNVLDEFEAIYELGESVRAIALELFLGCTLSHMDDIDQDAWEGLDLQRASTQIGLRVMGVLPSAILQSVPGGNALPGNPLSAFQSTLEQLIGAMPELPTFHSQARVEQPETPASSETAAVYPYDEDPVYEQLFEQIARALHRRHANHVLLTGERGVGLTTVFAELERRASAGKYPFLKDVHFKLINCRYTPPNESRQQLEGIFSEVAQKENLVLGIDGFTQLLKAEQGADNKGALLSALSQARCRVIGLLTPRDYEESIADGADELEFFTRIEVEEPDLEVSIRLMRHFAAGLEQQFGVKIDDQAIRQAVVLSANYILNERLPGKALKILHRVCENIDFDRSQAGAAVDSVRERDVVEAVSEVSGVPEETLRGIAEKSDYERSLKEEIVGQDHAVREVALELGLIKAGLTDCDKPASVMLFVGQTGTGKTEMAKALAKFYSTSKRLRTYTLGNFVESHSVAGIIGVPPGYVGHDQGGRMVNDLNSDPYCVFLLDEADKAHPDVLQPFLNLFDEGWIRDQRGTQAHGDKAIFILTTNVGQRMIADMANEGKTVEEMTTRMKETLAQIKHGKANRPVFAAEFLARIKRVILFQPLDRDAMVGIARKLFREMTYVWREKRQKSFSVPNALIEYIGDEAYRINEKSRGQVGGRIVRKLIADLVETRIQQEITDRPVEYRHSDSVLIEIGRNGTSNEENRRSSPEIEVRFAS